MSFWFLISGVNKMFMKCPLCHGETKTAFTVKGYSLLDCGRCTHRFTGIAPGKAHAETIYDDSYFNGGGAGYLDYLLEGKMLRQRGVMYAQKLESYTGPGRMLDIGAAAGFILKGFADEGWRGTGLEPNENMAAYGRQKLGLDLRCGTLETFDTGENFDLVTMIQVAAHFYEPRKAFETAARLLKNKGHLLIETWDRSSFSARIFGTHWHEYSPPSVLHWFSLSGLTEFLDTLGFEKVTHGRPAKKISGRHARSLLRYRLGDSFVLKLIPERMNFPYPSEDLFWALYRKK
jgi:SAM-dependent methyltransferase